MKPMIYSLTPPTRMSGAVRLPASKSISNRALVIHALAGMRSLPVNLSDCDDTRVMVSALESRPYEVDIKAAGTAMRFMTAYMSVSPGEEHVLTGTERMKHRPIHVLVDALRRLGADIDYLEEEGFPPLRVRGKALRGGELSIAGDVSSQYISALLMIGPVLERGLTLRLTGCLVSRPYVEMTMGMMKAFGAKVGWTGENVIRVQPVPYEPRGGYVVESDWSAASYWYEMMALTPASVTGELALSGLEERSSQGDSVVKDIFRSLGVETSFLPGKESEMGKALLRRGGKHAARLDYDFSCCPDLAQTIVVCCCELGVLFRFTGLRTLKIKETDRIEALKRECRKLGYVIHDERGDTLYWDGERCEAVMEPVATYEDHRMAMAFAPAVFRHPGLSIADPEVVSKSYPSYWEHLRGMGFGISII